MEAQLKAAVRDIPDYPKPGVVFKDITPLLQKAELFKGAIDLMRDLCTPLKPTHLVAIESRGFIFGAPLAIALNAGLVIVRKPNKLPYETESLEYALEYGTDKIEIHVDALGAKDRVVIVDDLLATGGTAAATAQLVEKLGARVAGLVFFAELEFLKAREKLAKDYTVASLLKL